MRRIDRVLGHRFHRRKWVIGPVSPMGRGLTRLAFDDFIMFIEQWEAS